EKVENLTFAEAVERLAEQAGVRLRYDGQSSADRRVAGRRQALYRANAEAGVLFHSMLLEGKEAAEAREYLVSRGIPTESVEKVENLTFAEAVERLAEQAGVRLRYDGQSSADRRVAGRRQALYRANAEAGVLFHSMLLEGKEAAEAREYLVSRGITTESVEK